jgi:hypothetical protein
MSKDIYYLYSQWYLLMMKTTEEVIAVDWNNVVRIVVATLVLEAFTEVLAIMVLMRVLNNAILA